MKKIAVICLSLLWISFNTQSQSIDIPSTFNPVGSGARALGLGGSFIAVADDATAASWNPSALMQLRKPEVALVLSNTQLKESAMFEVTNDSTSNSGNNTDVNYFAISAPCSAETCGLNMVFSLNYQRLYDLSRDWNFSITDDNSATVQHYNQSGALYAIGLAYAVQVNESLNLGITLNYWRNVFGQNGFTRKNNAIEVDIAPGDFFANSDITVTSDFEGINYNIGGLWTAYQEGESKLTVGFVYKSSFDADVSNMTDFFSQSGNESRPDRVNTLDLQFETPTTLTMPSSYGLGVAYQFSDALTTSIDFYRTNWNEFIQEDEFGVRSSPISGNQNAADIQDSTQIKVGLEYRIINQSIGSNYIIPLRAGFFVDPVIEDGSNADGYGVAIGAGIAFEHWVFDVAYQYRWADELGRSSQQQLGLVFDTQEHQLYASSFYRF
jgi:long-subunit fatty acid transport protein